MYKHVVISSLTVWILERINYGAPLLDKKIRLASVLINPDPGTSKLTGSTHIHTDTACVLRRGDRLFPKP